MANIQSTDAFDIAQWTAAACPPTVSAMAGESTTCPQRRAAALHQLTFINVDTVALGGAWERYLELGRSRDEIIGAVAETIRRLKTLGVKRIVIFGPGPLWRTSLPVDLFRFMARTRTSEVPERFGEVSDVLWSLDSAMAALAAADHVQYVSVLNSFCNKDGCLTVGDRSLSRPDLLYRDRDHLTVSGSKVLIAHSRAQLFGDT